MFFLNYIPETNGVGYSDVPQRVEVQPKNFKKLTPVTMKIWYDGVYKDGYDYRNVNESLSFSDKLNTYLSSWREKTVYGVNMYSEETSLTDTSLTINFNLSNSMAIQWNNGETATVVTGSDIPEYNFPLVINTYTVKYNGNGATSGSMSNMAMTYGTAKNLSANQFSCTGYTFKGWSTSANGFSKTGYSFSGWSTSANGAVIYTDKQSVKNLTTTAGSMPDIAMTYDTPVNLTVNRFTKTGYTFKNWNTKADGSGTSYADGESVKNLTARNGATVTLYAQWKTNQYTIVFYSNGGTGNMESITAVYDTPMQLPANTFAKETEYGVSVFEGWNRDAESLISLYPDCGTILNLTAENNGTVYLYAVWDDCPWIVAEDVYYTLEEAQNGQITYNELMSHASAHDREDGSPVLPGYNPEKGTLRVEMCCRDFMSCLCKHKQEK